MNADTPLPPGQYESDTFHRFGLTRFASRFPAERNRIAIEIVGDVKRSVVLSSELAELPRIEQTSSIHCVTTWSYRSLRWGGIRFADLYERVIRPICDPNAAATFVVLRGQDGANASLPLEDLLAPDVLLADTLDGRPLTVEHGAPIRLVAPAHYAYKSVKHLSRIGFWPDDSGYRPSGFRFMEHPRGRVEFEERGIGAPGWFFRYLYRPLVGITATRFRRALRHDGQEH